MINYCNFLSISRLGFLFLFFQVDPLLRLLAVFGAMVSDFLDGYLARKFCLTTRLGAVLDPLTDKLFVCTSVGILCFEGALSHKELLMVLSRDIFLFLFGLYLILTRGWRGYDYKAMFLGKVFTATQFLLLIAIILARRVHLYCFYPFVFLGLLACIERVLDYRKKNGVCPNRRGLGEDGSSVSLNLGKKV